jgi:hypothetical protein
MATEGVRHQIVVSAYTGAGEVKIRVKAYGRTRAFPVDTGIAFILNWAAWAKEDWQRAQEFRPRSGRLGVPTRATGIPRFR